MSVRGGKADLAVTSAASVAAVRGVGDIVVRTWCVVDAVAATSCSATLEANDLRSAMQPRLGGGTVAALFFPRRIDGGASYHQCDLTADILDTQPSSSVEPKDCPVHGTEKRQSERMPITTSLKGQIVDQACEYLLVFISLPDELSNSSQIVVARRRQDRAGNTTAKQDPAMCDNCFFEPLPWLCYLGDSDLYLATHGREAFLVHREKQVFLRRKVVVQRAGQNARRGTNFPNGCPFKSVPGK
jgi:hypothetical protein